MTIKEAIEYLQEYKDKDEEIVFGVWDIMWIIQDADLHGYNINEYKAIEIIREYEKDPREIGADSLSDFIKNYLSNQ